MTATTISEVSLIDQVVRGVAKALLSSRHFHSLCSTALHRYSRSVVLQHLTTALAAFSRTLQKYADNPTSKATAWLLDGCGTAIALQVCETLSPEKDILAQLLSALEPNIVTSNTERFFEFLDTEFKGSEQSASGTAQDWGFGNPNPDPHGRTYQDSAGYLPDLDSLSEVTDFESVVCTQPALNTLCTSLTQALFSSPYVLLETTLHKYVLDNGQKYSLACILEWEVLQFIRNEQIVVDDLECLFTVNGALDCASVSRLGDYVRGTWKSGDSFLSLLKDLVHKVSTAEPTQIARGITVTGSHGIVIQMFPATKGIREQSYLKLVGTYDTLIELLQQFAWTAATLRPHFDGQLTVSDIDFHAEPTPTANMRATYPPTVFYLSVFDKKNTVQASPNMRGQCWTSVLTESTLAHGFPLLKSNRPKDGVGLELPFEFMTGFTGVKYPIMVKESIVFANMSSVLIPQHRIDNNSIQWHFRMSERWLDDLVLKNSWKPDPALQTLNLTSFTRSRVFLGFCKSAENLLGTRDFEHVDPSESGVTSVSQVAFDSSDASFGLRIENGGYVRAADGTKWRFKRGEMAQLEGPDMFSDSRLLRASGSSVLLYDQESCIAALVSELSLVLQLVTAYLRTASQLKRQRIPLAGVAADGGKAAYECIMKAKDIVVSYPNKEPQKYSRIVEEFLDLLQQRKTQTLARKQSDNPTADSHHLRGWDHAALQMEKHEIFERELASPYPKNCPIWWELFQDSTTLVLFTKLSKPPIRNSNTEPRFSSFNCRAWDDIPKGHHILLAPTIQLHRFTAEACQTPRRYATRHMLNNNMIWARPRASRLFEHNCKPGGSCNPIQTMIQGSSGDGYSPDPPEGFTDGSKYLHHPGDMEDTGAVLFADDPTQFEPRACWRHGRTPVLGGTEWNYPYIAVTCVVGALAYWNFRLLVVNVVLLAIARYLK